MQAANVVIFADAWFNPAVVAQALSRVHRLGQTKTVWVKRLVVARSVELDMLRIEKRKAAMAAAALDSGAAAGGAKLSEEDLRMLFMR